jgi:hypothetical protein
MNDFRDEYHRKVQALIAQRAAETTPIRVLPRRASGRVICIACKEPMLDGSGALHRGECGGCRKHTRGTIAAEPVRPYGDDPPQTAA